MQWAFNCHSTITIKNGKGIMKLIFFTTLGFLSFILIGCASSMQKQVQQEAAVQTDVHSNHDAVDSGRNAILNSTKLNQQQKDQFLQVMAHTEDEMTDIRAQEGKLKAALFQSLSQGEYNPFKISVYQSKLKKLENKKLDLMFASLKKVRHILGKDPQFNQEEYLFDFNMFEMSR
jgi:hypothetical protein